MSPVLNVLNGSYFVIKVFDVSDCFSSVFFQIFFLCFLAIFFEEIKKNSILITMRNVTFIKNQKSRKSQ